MKQHIKRIVALALALTMVMALAACGEKPAASSADDGARKSITIGIQTRPSVASFDDNLLTNYLEEKLNCDIEFVYFATGATEVRAQVNAILAAGEPLPDIMWSFGYNDAARYEYGRDGYFIDLKPYFDGELGKAYRERMAELYGEGHYEHIMKHIASPDGAVYAFPDVNSSATSGVQYQVAINKVWLDNLGLEMPTNYEELVTVLRAFRDKDPNGNGKPDEIPAIGFTGASNITTGSTTYNLPVWLLNIWQYTDDYKSLNVDENGKLYSPFTTEEYRKGVQALHDLVEEKLLSPLSWTLASREELQAINTPAEGPAIAGLIGGGLSLVANGNPTAYEYEAVPAFNYSPQASTVPGAYTYITSDCDDPEFAFRLLAEMATEEAAMIFTRGQEGVNWELVDDDSEYGKAFHRLEPLKSPYNHFWGAYGCALFVSGKHTVFHDVPNPENVWQNTINGKNDVYLIGERAIAAERNPQVVEKIMYNAEESEKVGSIDAEILTYVKECRAKFAVGEMDPYDDAQWANYVATIDAMGFQEWLAIAQGAWDRVNG